ncbi:hypothetical protein AB0E63_25865 [Kribbella sp. NPDC026596]|uniref:hypothetical protein n=1 Tax=Kribbella sp. NPDC026596 TaxID=3155122 RepID=UPI0033F9DD11
MASRARTAAVKLGSLLAMMAAVAPGPSRFSRISCSGDSTRFTGDRDLTKVRELNPPLQSLDEWLAKRKAAFKLEPTL